MPGVEALLPRFQAAHTQVLGVSIDSVHCHANWARDLGGVSFPLLADFQPKGSVADCYGAYLAKPGITDRATVIIDSGGTVRHASSVGPAGERDVAELVALCEKIDGDGSTSTVDTPAPQGLGTDAVLFMKHPCGFSRRVQVAVDWLSSCYRGEEAISIIEDALASWARELPASKRALLLAAGSPETRSGVSRAASAILSGSTPGSGSPTTEPSSHPFPQRLVLPVIADQARVRCPVIADQSFFLGVSMGFRVDSAMILLFLLLQRLVCCPLSFSPL